MRNYKVDKVIFKTEKTIISWATILQDQIAKRSFKEFDIVSNQLISLLFEYDEFKAIKNDGTSVLSRFFLFFLHDFY